MRIALPTLLLAGATLTAGWSAYAQEHNHDMHQHAAATASDGRQIVKFPAEMRTHTLANMRGHLLALSEILEAMSNSQYAKAAQIADSRLGMESPGAQGCKAGSGTTSMPDMPSMPMPGMDQQMALYMPPEMRDLGQRMHQSANEFAIKANESEKTRDPGPAFAALSRVTANCVACHAAYRLQ